MKKQPISGFRLVTGEDIIARYETQHKVECEFITIYTPMKLVYKRFPNGIVGIILIPWLPEEILEKVDGPLFLPNRDIQVRFPIREKMKEFYIEVTNLQIEQLTKYSNDINKNIDQLKSSFLKQNKDGGMNMTMEARMDEFFNNFESSNTTPVN